MGSVATVARVGMTTAGRVETISVVSVVSVARAVTTSVGNAVSVARVVMTTAALGVSVMRTRHPRMLPSSVAQRCSPRRVRVNTGKTSPLLLVKTEMSGW